MLTERFGVFDTDIHIEPAPISEGEILDNVYKKLLMREQLIDQEINWKSYWLRILFIYPSRWTQRTEQAEKNDLCYQKFI